MSKIVCFGELMMRFNPEGYLRFIQAERFEASFAGGEANVAVSLANFGHDVYFVSKLPEHVLGQSAINELRKFGVNTVYISRGTGRLGLYFVEKGASQRGSNVIYDRANSAIALAQNQDFDWETILKDSEWFHFTGITPALGENLPQICMDALKVCKKKEIPVSCDINYRSKLWTREKAREVMSSLMPYVNVVISNEEDAKDVFGIIAEGSDVEKGVLNNESYASVAKELMNRFSFDKVAITLRGSISASENTWSGLIYDGLNCFFAKDYHIHIVDRIGGGDSFGAALIHSLIRGVDDQQAIEFAVAASCLKQTIEGDFNHVTEKEILQLVGGNESGRVQR